MTCNQDKIQKTPISGSCESCKKPRSHPSRACRSTRHEHGWLELLPTRPDRQGLCEDAELSEQQNKFKYVYLLTPRGIAEKVALTNRLLRRKMEEYEALKEEIKSEMDATGNDGEQKA